MLLHRLPFALALLACCFQPAPAASAVAAVAAAYCFAVLQPLLLPLLPPPLLLLSVPALPFCLAAAARAQKLEKKSGQRTQHRRSRRHGPRTGDKYVWCTLFKDCQMVKGRQRLTDGRLESIGHTRDDMFCMTTSSSFTLFA